MAVNFYKETARDRVFNIVNYALITLLFLMILYPLILVISSSFSSGHAIIMGRVRLWPVEFNLNGYKEIFEYKSVFIGYGNSLFYLALGTGINMVFSIMAAYPLSRWDLIGRKTISLLFIFTMLFNAGLIPNYLLMKELGLIDHRLVMIMPKALSAWNVMVMITYFRSNVPDELHEAARIDGCNDFRFVLSILLPISKPIIAVIALFYAVGHWNSYFDAMIYLNSAGKFPLQLVLKEILLQNQLTVDMMSNMQLTTEEMSIRMSLSEQLKYALIIVASVPLMICYPFVQKYFVKGIMLGSLKG